MKFSSVTATLITAFAAGSATATALPNQGIQSTPDLKGGFAESCKDINLKTNRVQSGVFYTIEAVCPDGNDVEYDNTLNLNLCLVNHRGVMHWGRRGKFDKSCVDCEINPKGESVSMTCMCGPGAGAPRVQASIDLNDNIRNQGGQIWCGEEVGGRSG